MKQWKRIHCRKTQVINIKILRVKYIKLLRVIIQHVKSSCNLEKRRSGRLVCASQKSVSENKNSVRFMTKKKNHTKINECKKNVTVGRHEFGALEHSTYNINVMACSTMTETHYRIYNSHNVLCYILCEQWWWMGIMEQLIKYIVRSERCARTSIY